MNMIQVKDLYKEYGKSGARVMALGGINLEVPRGQFLAIVGPSGSGKSTLLHMLGGVDRPTSGQIFIDGTDITQLDATKLAVFRRRQIGLIYQFYNLLPVLNVRENIQLPLLLDGRKPDPVQVEGLISNLGLYDRMNHLPNELSGGQQQRVSIGRALVANPAIVLADEPTGNLDRKNTAEILDLLRVSNTLYHQTLLMITHDEEIALKADRIVRLEDGKIVGDEVLRK